jgi:hypothetical protein
MNRKPKKTNRLQRDGKITADRNLFDLPTLKATDPKHQLGVPPFIARCLAISLGPTAAFAEERHDYVFVSEAAFAAFQCSVFAAHARYDTEEKRLFSYGLEQARLFIQAARGGRVSREEFNRTNFVWPLALRIWNFQPQDTSTDFVAGTVYEMIWDTTTENLGNQSRGTTYQDPARARAKLDVDWALRAAVGPMGARCPLVAGADAIRLVRDDLNRMAAISQHKLGPPRLRDARMLGRLTRDGWLPFADRAALSTPPSCRGFPRATGQNGASVTPRQRRNVHRSGQPALGRVPCRPTPTRVPCSWHHPARLTGQVRDLRMSKRRTPIEIVEFGLEGSGRSPS